MQYFKHQSNMRHDLKIRRVVQRYGLEGYGLYNLIVESITESLTTDSPLPDLAENCEDIATLYNGNTSHINEIMNYMINQGLFELDELTGRVLCEKVYKFLDSSQTRSEKVREMIKNYKSSVNLLPETTSDLSQTVSDKSRQSLTNMKETEEESERETDYKEKNTKKEKPDSDSHDWKPPGTTMSDTVSKIIEHWNSCGNLPHCRYQSFNVPSLSDFGNRIDLFSLEEINKAITNLSTHWDDIDGKYRPSTISSFMRNSFDAWTDESKPWERYQGKQPTISAEEADRMALEVFKPRRKG